MGWCLAELGEFASASAADDEGIRIAEAVGQPYSLVVAYFGAGHVQLVKGEFARSLFWLERSLDLCRGENFAYLFGWVASSLGQVYAHIGRIAEGAALLRQSLEQSTAMKIMARYPRLETLLGEMHLLALEHDEALAVTLHAIELTRTHGQRGVEAEALRILGDIKVTADPPDPDAAAAAYRSALALAEDLEARPLVAHCHLGLGKLCGRIGQSELAREHLTTAATLYRVMDMGYWLAQVDAALGPYAAT